MPIDNRTNVNRAAVGRNTVNTANTDAANNVNTNTVNTTAPVSSDGASTSAGGLDAATDANVAPNASNQVLGGGLNAASIGQLAGLNFQAADAKSIFGLVPGRVPDAVGLDVVLQQVAKSPQGQGALKQLAQQFSAKTGVDIPPAMLAAAQAKPELLANIMQLTPAEMSQGMQALNAAHQAGQVDDVKPRTLLLPQKFSFDDLDQIAFTRPEPQIKELAPGLFQGGVKNDALSDEGAKMNTVVAEVFHRLAGNSDLDPKERFSVEIGGSKCTRVDTFVKALRKQGYDINVTFEHRVANFSELLTKAPNGAFVDVPAPLMVRVQDQQQKDVGIVPAVHSEVVIQLKSGPNTKGPKLDSDVKWYQGISGTGFFPVGLNKTPNWCGKNVSDTLSGDAADKAVDLCGLMGDVINASASQLDLIASGYGVTGVCNDSVAIVHHAMTGEAKESPLLMQDATLLSELQRRVSDNNHRDDPKYDALIDSIQQVPSDQQSNATTVSRALSCMPWAEGQAPFASTDAFVQNAKG